MKFRNPSSGEQNIIFFNFINAYIDCIFFFIIKKKLQRKAVLIFNCVYWKYLLVEPAKHQHQFFANEISKLGKKQ